MTGFMLLILSISIFLLVVLTIIFGVKEDVEKEKEDNKNDLK